jgi:hypothetical protein
VYRVRNCLRRSRNEEIPLWLFCRFVGAVTDAGLARASATRAPRVSESGASLLDVRDDQSFSRGEEFDLGAAARASGVPWWPRGADAEAVEEIAELVTELASAKASLARLAYTPIGHAHAAKWSSWLGEDAPKAPRSGSGSGGSAKKKTQTTKPFSLDDDDHIVDRMERRRVASEAAKERAIQEKAAREREECTFSPKLNRKSVAMVRDADAANRWAARKLKEGFHSLMTTAERREAESLKECTFKPAIRKAPKRWDSVEEDATPKTRKKAPTTLMYGNGYASTYQHVPGTTLRRPWEPKPIPKARPAPKLPTPPKPIKGFDDAVYRMKLGRVVREETELRCVLYTRFSPTARFQHLIAWVPFN